MLVLQFITVEILFFLKPTQLRFVKLHLNKPQTFWTSVLIKHGGGGTMSWAYFAATGSAHVAVIKSTMNQI